MNDLGTAAPPNEDGTESALVAGLRAGADSAYEQMVRLYCARLLTVARRILSHEEDAQEAVQDAFLSAFKGLASFDGASRLYTWLHRITVNAALSHRRRRAVREEHRSHDPLDILLEEESPSLLRPWTLAPDTQVLHQETRHLIGRAIDQLPELYRTVFVLSDVEGLPNAETAGRLGLSLPAMKSRLHRARLLLREALAPHFEEIAV
jgi:RNA polymerase sigma-70 factor, ECF subfamily